MRGSPDRIVIDRGQRIGDVENGQHAAPSVKASSTPASHGVSAPPVSRPGLETRSERYRRRLALMEQHLALPCAPDLSCSRADLPWSGGGRTCETTHGRDRLRCWRRWRLGAGALVVGAAAARTTGARREVAVTIGLAGSAAQVRLAAPWMERPATPAGACRTGRSQASCSRPTPAK